MDVCYSKFAFGIAFHQASVCFPYILFDIFFWLFHREEAYLGESPTASDLCYQ